MQTLGDSLPQAVFTLPSSIYHRFFRNQDSLVVCSPHNVVYENGHTFAQPHLEVLLVRHVTDLLAKIPLQKQALRYCDGS